MNPRLSASQISMFLKCPRQWAFRYIEGKKIPPSGAMKQSGVFHTAAEKNYKQKVDSKVDLPVSDMEDFYADEFEREFKREEVILDEGQTKAALKDQGIDIVRAHREAIAPKVQPVEVEEWFKLYLTSDKNNPDVTFELTGKIDVVDDTGRIRDNKAYGKTPNQTDLDRDVQLSTYSLARRMLTKSVEPELVIDAVIKTKRPEGKILTTRRNREGLRLHLELIENVAKAIKAEAFPINPTGWWCSPKFCGYWSLCMGRGMVTVDMGENLQQKLEESLKPN